MISVSTVSIILLIVWFLSYLKLRRYAETSKIYFLLLFIMGIPGLIIDPLPLMGLEPRYFHIKNVLLFAFLMIIILIPWFAFDKFMKKKPIIVIRDNYIKYFRIVFIFTILLSLYSIIYTLPFAIKAYQIGLDNIRNLGSDALLPKSIFTTLALGSTSLTPIIVLFVFISFTDFRLYHYTKWLVLASLSYIIATTSIAARDGYIYLLLLYICFYYIFKKSLNNVIKSRIKKIAIIGCILLFLGNAAITIDRFYNNRFENELRDDIIYGTWGYFYQQPYVFAHILEDFHYFYGFKRRLKFLDGIIKTEMSYEYDLTSALKEEYMFGSQFAEFYEINGYSSLFIITLIYIFIFYFLINYHYRKNNTFSLLIVFSLYLYFTISGMFYFRFGGNNNVFLLYFLLLVSTTYIPNFLKYIASRNK